MLAKVPDGPAKNPTGGFILDSTTDSGPHPKGRRRRPQWLPGFVRDVAVEVIGGLVLLAIVGGGALLLAII